MDTKMRDRYQQRLSPHLFSSGKTILFCRKSENQNYKATRTGAIPFLLVEAVSRSASDDGGTLARIVTNW